MLIFNTTALIIGAVALVFGGGIDALFEPESTLWPYLVGGLVAAAGDLAWRMMTNDEPDEDGDVPGTVGKLLGPGMGGHVFFVPFWIAGLALAVLGIKDGLGM